MSLSVARIAVRSQRAISRQSLAQQCRQQSNVTEAASKAKETTNEVASKAQQGLSRVTSSAGSAITKVGGALGSTLGSIGGRTGRLIGFVQSMIPPTIYYSRVGLELGKIIFNGRAMNIPSGAQFQTYFQPLLKTLRNPSSFNPNMSIQSLRNISHAQLAAGGVVLAEVLGFFTIGTMIGRLKVTGYHSRHYGEHH